MLESTRDKTNGTQKDRRKQDLPFYGISIALHAIVIGAVLWISPVREIFFEREKPEEPEIITSGDELEEIIDDIRDRTVEQLKMRVQLLDLGQERMANNFRILNEYHQPFVEQQQATAMLRFSRYAEAALTRQKLLMDVYLKASETKNEDVYREAIDASFKNVSQIFTAQEEIRRGILLLGIEDEALMAKQHDVEETQITSENAQRWFAQGLDQLVNAREKLEEVKVTIPTTRETIVDLDKQIGTKMAKREEIKQQIDKLDGQIRELGNKKETQEARKKLQDQKNQLSDEMKKHSYQNEDRELNREKDRLQNLLKQQEDLETRITKAYETLATHLQLALNTQRGVYYRQKEIVDTVKLMLDNNQEAEGDENI